MPMQLKTKEAGKVKLNGTLKVLQRLNEYEFGVELRVMREGLNRNGWDYRNLEANYLSFVGQPILCAYVGNRVGDGHNMEEVRDPATGKTRYSFMGGTAERIVGALSDDKADFKITEENGEKWLIAKGKLWEFYAPELVNKIVRAGTMEVSAETDITEEHKDGEIDVFTAWNGLGVTVLGDGVAPAIPGANIKALAALSDEYKNAKLKAAAYLAQNSNPQNEPQLKKKSKGVKSKLKAFNKSMIAETQKRFNGYTVLGGAEFEDCTRVCLMNAEGKMFRYTFNSGDVTVVPEKMEAICANAVITLTDDCSIEFDMDEFTGKINSDLVTVNAELAKAKQDLENANSTITAMTNAECARRVKEAGKIAKETLAAFNANRDDKIEDSEISGIQADIENGVYTNSLDGEGKWIGGEKVRDAVLAKCAAAVMELDKKSAAEKKTTLAYNALHKQQNPDDGTVEGLLATWGIE